MPISPYPCTEEAFGHVDWSEDDAEEMEELEYKEMYHDVEKMVVAEKAHEVVHLETQMHLAAASKLFEEQQRRPVTLGQPKLPSLAEQELHFVTHWPYAPWCQACVACRAKEDHYKNVSEKEDIGKNITQLDFFYTHTGEEGRLDETPSGKVQERQDQYGTCLVAVSSETKAIHTVPIHTKGSASLKNVTEEIVRFTLENASRDQCILQADGERATRQILRSVQQVRSVMGLQTELRITGAGQHASNGQAERAVQTVRRLASCLRAFAEDRARINILGNFHLFPWSFRHAAFLINRFRVLDGCKKTSYELATGHAYRGKLALFGESVMFKRIVQYKGSGTFERGIWAGKHPWTDCHIILTENGAFESRTIRRLAPEDSFKSVDILCARGLPWSYSPQGILMRHAGQAQKYRMPTLETDATEEDMKQIATDVAAGVVTPAPGLRAQPTTPGIAIPAPSTPALMSPRSKGDKRPLLEEEKEDEHEEKKLDKSTSPRRAHEKRVIEVSDDEDEKKARVELPRTPEAPIESAPTDRSAQASTTSSGPLYPPHFAGVNAVEAHGDEEVGVDYIPEDVMEEEMWGYGGEEGDDPPEVSEEELEHLDAMAREKEINRMLEMPAMVEVGAEEVEANGGYIISTKEVMCWKHRLDQGGWFRRARLVARQFRNSVQLEQTFAPTGMMCLPKMLIHLTLNVYGGFSVMTLDVKDAFLMSPQPAEERAYVRVNGRIFKLLRCLPGQRTAASQWFQQFAGACIEFGMKQDPMQPTLLYIPEELYLTVRVDDVFMVGITQRLRDFVNYLKERRGTIQTWRIPEEGVLRPHHCDVRCDRKQYDSFEKDVDLFSRFYRKTPLDANFTKKDTSPVLEGGEVTKYRSTVGRLMYLAGERPDAQFAIQCLARHMAKPTAQATKHAWRVCSYLFGTGGFGVRIDSKSRGQSVMDRRRSVDVEPQDQHMVEVVTDADYAGNQHDRKSTSSFQIFIDGNLVESKVRSQKAISCHPEKQSLWQWWQDAQKGC